MDNTYYIMVNSGIPTIKVVDICKLIGIYNLKYRDAYIKMWYVDDEQIQKLNTVLLDLDVDFDIAKRLKFEK